MRELQRTPTAGRRVVNKRRSSMLGAEHFRPMNELLQRDFLSRLSLLNGHYLQKVLKFTEVLEFSRATKPLSHNIA